MIRSELIQKIADENPHLTQKHVEKIVSTVFDEIIEALAKGDRVELRGFGAFSVKARDARVGRNPNAPETDVPIPQRAVVKFKPGKEMRETVIKLTPEQVEAALKAQAAEEKHKGPEADH